jgi:DNA-binding MarR family transcriptional regulator
LTKSREEADLEALRAERAINLRQLLLRAHRVLNAEIVARLAARGHTKMRVAHIAIFSTIDFEGTRLNVLAERANMTKQGMGQLARDLEKLGYLKRGIDPSDHRAKIVRFTDAGWKVMLDSLDVLREVEVAWRQIVGERALADLRKTVSAIVGQAVLSAETAKSPKRKRKRSHPK